MGKTNDLIDFMKNLTLEMGEEYKRIRKRSLEDSGTAGDQGEENWASILREWLPADYQIVTKGRLLNASGETSPQVDVLVLYPFYPKGLLYKKLYLTAGVAAAFECKNTLKATHIEKCFRNCVQIKNLYEKDSGSYDAELNSPIIYGLLAHSHVWKKEFWDVMQLLHVKLGELDQQFVNDPRDLIDFICISDLSAWSCFKSPMKPITTREGKRVEELDWEHGPQTGYGMAADLSSDSKERPSPIGAFLTRLMQKLSLTDKRLTQFATYFREVGLSPGDIRAFRAWPSNFLSEKAIQQLDNIPNFKKYRTFSKEGLI